MRSKRSRIPIFVGATRRTRRIIFTSTSSTTFASCCCWWMSCCLAIIVVNGFVFQTATKTRTTIQKRHVLAKKRFLLPFLLFPPTVAHPLFASSCQGGSKKASEHHCADEHHNSPPLRDIVRLKLSAENDSSSSSSSSGGDSRQEKNHIIIPQTAPPARRTFSSSASSSSSSSSLFSSMDGGGGSHDDRFSVLLLSKNNRAEAVLEAAASHTQESCRLLGVKSLGVDYGLVRTGLAISIGYNPRPLAIITSKNTTMSTEPVVTRTVVRNKHTNMDEDVITRHHQVVQDMTSVAFVCDEILRHAAMQGNDVSRIIVGLPLHKNGTVAPQTNRTLIFAQELARRATSQLGPQHFVGGVLLWDERYTSKEAAARVHTAAMSSSSATGPTNSNHRDLQSLYSGMLDDEAACIILENYYHENGQGAQPVILSNEVREECLREFQRRQVETVVNQQAIQREREAKMERKRLAIARDHHQRQVEEAERMAAQSGGGGDDGTCKKKKKKKKKR
jgi:RNase H-fold protein (predicted Holliday junction resolvase)